MERAFTKTGGCHCQRVRFIVDLSAATFLECNCSICRKKGFLHAIVDRSAFTLVSGEGDLTTYTFGTHVAQHLFCSTCGISSYYIPRSHPDKVDVNARCLDEEIDIQFDSFDGQNWEHAHAVLSKDSES